MWASEGKQRSGFLAMLPAIIIRHFAGHPLRQVVQPSYFVEMIADDHMMYHQGVSEFKCCSMGMSFYQLQQAVVEDLKGTTGSRCIFQDVVFSINWANQSLALHSDTRMSPNVALVSCPDAVAAMLNSKSYKTSALILDIEISIVMNSTKA